VVHGGRRARLEGDTCADMIEQRGAGFVHGVVSRLPCDLREGEVPPKMIWRTRSLGGEGGVRQEQG
jgi:hypothetical protein